MELKGILDTSLGNFLCVRGFAKLGDLYDVSDYDESFQRKLIETHKIEVVNFLNDQKYLFFPEVILGGELSDDDDFESNGVSELYEKFGYGDSFKISFKNFALQVNVAKTKSKKDARVYDYLRQAKIVIADKKFNSDSKKPFTRIDGNHRISAVEAEPNFRNINTPFCIILFRRPSEKSEFSRVIFHNINSKSIPVGLEHSTRLILDNEKIYPDETLKNSPSFGIQYFFARKLYKNVDFDLLQNIDNSFRCIDNNDHEYASTFLKIFKFLLDKKEISESENTIRRFKDALSIINMLYSKNDNLKASKNDGLLSSFIYFQLCKDSEAIVPSFYDWVTNNHITEIDYLNPNDLTKVFDKIIRSKNRTIFVSMAFGLEKTDNHYKIIERICIEINEQYKLKIKLKAERVDWFSDGTSYNINDKILTMIGDSGMLVGNLTYARPNVYHEIGFLMGRDKAIGLTSNNFLLILDESVNEPAEKKVGFNLSSIKQIRFTETEKLAEQLKDNFEKFYSLKAIN